MSEMNITARWRDGSGFQCTLDRHPDQCPVCNRGIDSVRSSPGFARKTEYAMSDVLLVSVEVVFRCPFKDCDRLFLALYEDSAPYGRLTVASLVTVYPKHHVPRDFEKTIRDVSKSFCNIYDQASVAEAKALSEICGLGYRKALEFLIKDYLKLTVGDGVVAPSDTQETPQEANKTKEVAWKTSNKVTNDEIEKTSLGNCIKNWIKSSQIKRAAERATWLGNDEAHYVRVWQDQDVSDLKMLIELVLHGIEMDAVDQHYEDEMPNKAEAKSRRTVSK